MTNSAFNPELHPRAAVGTFKDKEQSAPELSLEAEAPAEKTPRNSARDFAAWATHEDPRIAREGSAALLAEVTRTVRNMRRKTGLSEDQTNDAIGDTMVDLFGRINQGHNIRGGLIQVAASAVCSRYVNGPIRHEAAKAIKILKERVAEEEQRLGHHITSADVARIANNVRMGKDFVSQHRPPQDFHLLEQFVRPTSFSQYPESYIDEQMKNFDYGIEADFVGEGSAADQLAEQLEQKGVSKAAARRKLYEVIAQDAEAPAVKANWISQADARMITEHMAAQKNGVIDALRDYEDGKNTPNIRALFAPFGEISNGQKEQIVTLLTERSGHASQIWESAVNAATHTKEHHAALREAERARKLAASAK